MIVGFSGREVIGNLGKSSFGAVVAAKPCRSMFRRRLEEGDWRR